MKPQGKTSPEGDTKLKERPLPMTNKLYDDSNWREEYKVYTSNKRHLELLRMDLRVLDGYYKHCIINGKR